jgi:hypothetical protein
MMNVIEKVQLRSRRADDQDFVRIGESERELSKKPMVIVGMLLVAILVGLLAFGVLVEMPVRGLDGVLGETVGAHLKDACLAMIEPYCGAVIFHDAKVTIRTTVSHR